MAHANDTKTHSGDQTSLNYMGMFSTLNLPVPFLQRTPVGQLVSNGQTIPVMGGIKVIHTPGHTSGSVCYMLESRSLLFSGDTLFSNGQRVSRSVPFPGSNAHHYRDSLNSLAKLDFDALCGGHGVPMTSGASDGLRELLALRPEPPSWGAFIRSVPRRVYEARSLRGEDY